MDKSPDAFRTISEVADVLETPAHVLRFWESRFPQIRPVKRAGGRRYYRPADVALLTGIKRLLHEEGLTIRGVQKILREQGVRHVAGLAGMPEADLAPFDPAVALEEAMADRFGAEPGVALPIAEVETAQIFALETALRRTGPDRRTAARPDAPAATADFFDLLAEGVGAAPAAPEAAPLPEPTPAPEAASVPEPAALEIAPLSDAAPAVPEVPTVPHPAPPDAVIEVSRAALLRALPTPLPDELRAVLVPLRDRIAAHCARLHAAARAAGSRV